MDAPEHARERHEFASTLFNEDLKDLLNWHKDRPLSEQKRFLRSLDNLYGAARCQKKTKPQETVQADVKPLEPSPLAETRSVSTPSLQALKPIDMFLQKQKDMRTRKSVSKGDMELWLDQKSCSSAPVSTASSWTRWSQMTGTTQSSVSGLEPTTKQAYKKHARAFAVNRRLWKAVGAHDSTQNLPTDGFPDLLRFRTTTSGAYGDVKKGSNPINEKMYESMFKDEKHPFIADYLKDASPRSRDGFCRMVRCLENMRVKKYFKTSHQRDFNLKEQNKLWVPSNPKPRVKDADSLVPLGTIRELVDFHRENTGQSKRMPPPLPRNCDILVLDDHVEGSHQNTQFAPSLDGTSAYSE